jgi:hypothetical protein
MPIAGVSDIRRIPRIGKLRLGVRKKSDKGKEYPSAVDFFVCNADKSTPQWAADAFHARYGNQPKSIDIMFPCEEIDRFFPQDYRRYGSGTGLVCKGDGIKAQCLNQEQGGLVEIPCLGQECEFCKKNHCKHVGTVQFLLPEVTGLGVWQIDTTSFHSIVNLNSSIDFIRGMTGAKQTDDGKLIGGRIAMIPLKLAIIPKEVSPEGHKKTVYVLTIANEQIKLIDIIKSSTLSPIQLFLPELDLDTPPDDLYPQSLINPDGPVASTDDKVDTQTEPVVTIDITPSVQKQEDPPKTEQTEQRGGRTLKVLTLIGNSGATPDQIGIVLDKMIPAFRNDGKTDWRSLLQNAELYNQVCNCFSNGNWLKVYQEAMQARPKGDNVSDDLFSSVHPLIETIQKSGASFEVAKIIIEHDFPGIIQDGEIKILNISSSQMITLKQLFSTDTWQDRYMSIMQYEAV